MRKWSLYEIEKMLDAMIGGTEPVADSMIDSIVKDNVEVMTSVIDWCLSGMQRTASYRKSNYDLLFPVGADIENGEIYEWMKDTFAIALEEF